MAGLPRALGVPGVVDMLRRSGRGQDSILAHINPREAQLLRDHGGSGTTNPQTGIVEFDDTGLTTGYFSGESAPAPDYNLNVDAPTPGMTQSTFGSTPQVNYNLNVDGPSSPGLTSSYSPGSADTAGGGSAGSSDTPLNFSSMTGASPSPSGVGLTPTTSFAPVPGVDANAPASTGGLSGLLSSGEAFAKNNKNLLSLAGTLGLGAFNQHKATAEGNAAENKIKSLAAPYRTQANAALIGAASGNLTPAMQQQLQGLRAQANQTLSNNGQGSGIAAQQAASNIQQQASLFQQQLMDKGLQLAGVADQLTLQAINAGYQSDQAAQKAANGFYTAIFQAIGNAGK